VTVESKGSDLNNMKSRNLCKKKWT